jgi:histidine kinase
MSVLVYEVVVSYFKESVQSLQQIEEAKSVSHEIMRQAAAEEEENNQSVQSLQPLQQTEEAKSVSWASNTDLRQIGIDLYTNAARAEYCAGNVDESMKYLDRILPESLISQEEKFEAYLIQSLALAAQQKHQEEFNSILGLLRQVGVKFPPRAVLSIAIIVDLQKTKSLLRNKSTDDLIKLPDMQDERRLQIMRLLDRALNVSFILGDPLMPFFVFKQVRWTVKFGIAPPSASVFSSYAALIAASLGELKRAGGYSKVSIGLSKRPMCRAFTARILMTVYVYGIHWSTPMQTCVKPLLHGFEVGLKKGDLENSFYCCYSYALNGNVAGYKLHIIEEDINDFQRSMSIYHQEQTYKMCLSQLYFVRSMINGEDMKFDELMKEYTESNHVPMLDITRHMQLQHAVYFNNYDIAWKMVNVSRTLPTTCIGQPAVWRHVFFVGVTAFELARKASRSDDKVAGGVSFAALKKEGKACVSKLKDWVQRGHVNCVHLYRILDAESMSIHPNPSGKTKAVTLSLYEGAIVASTRSGFVHDRALCYELAANYLIDIAYTDDERLLKDYQEYAIAGYELWGALAKVKSLEERWSRL